MAKVAVGMEVNQRVIRLVQLKQSRRGPALDGKAELAIPEGIITRTGVADPEAFRSFVVQALAKAEAGKANVCLGVSSEETDIRQVELPLMPEKDLAQAIRWELSQVPLFGAESTGDILFDYQALGEAEDGERTLLVVSAPKRLVYGYLNPLQKAGIHPEIFDIGGFAVPWSCPREGGVAYVHLGPEMLHLLFYQKQKYKLSRQLPLPLESVLDLEKHEEDADGEEGIAVESSNLSKLDAAMAAEAGSGPVSKVIRELTNVVIQTMEYYRAKERVSNLTDLVDTLVLSGEGSQVEGFTNLFDEETGIRTTLADPMIGPGDEGVLGEEASAYAVAVGLAVRGLAEL